MSYGREKFEQAVKDKWSDSFLFDRDTDGDYADEAVNYMWLGWLASRQAIECEPVAWVHEKVLKLGRKRFEGRTDFPYGMESIGMVPLYTHPASAQAPEEIERDGINSTENLAYIDGYNDCAKEVRENARSNKQAVSVPKQWVDLMRELVKDLISEIKTKQSRSSSLTSVSLKTWERCVKLSQ